MGHGTMLVADFMERQVVTLDVGERLDVADAVMRLGRIRHLPVVDQDRLVGVLSQRDLFRAAASSQLELAAEQNRAELARIRVAEVMVPDPVTIAPEDNIRYAADLMLIHRIGCLPVVRGRALVGLLSESDCLRVLTAVLAYREGVADAARGLRLAAS